MSKARDLADFGSNPDEQTSTITVTVAGGKFVIDGTSQQTITMAASGVYKFDQSDSSNASHPLKISTTSDGTHGGGSAITVDFVAVGTAGSAGAYVTYTIQQDGADNYFYYCGNHSGMGGSIRKSGNPTAAEILTSIKTVDGTGSGLDADTLDGVEAAALLPLSGGTMTGNLVLGDNVKATFGAGSDLQIYHDGSSSIIKDAGTGNLAIQAEDFAVQSSDGSATHIFVDTSSGYTSFGYGGSTKLATTNTGVSVTGTVAATALTGDGAGITGLSGGGEQTFTASGSISAGNIVGINSSGTVEVMGQEESGVVQVGTRDPYSPEYFPQGIATDGNGKVLAVIGTSANGGPAAYVGTITGTTISWGSEYEITSNTDQYSPYVTYDANAGKFLIYWYNASGSYTGHAVVATVSGTSVSFGTIIQVSSAGRQGQVLYNPDTQSSLIAYWTTSGVWASVATISGTSVSLGSPLQVSSGSSHNYPRLTYDTSANKYLCAYRKGNGNGAAKVLTVSGTSVTAGSEATFETTAGIFYLGTTYDPTANRHIMQHHPGNGAKVVAGTISGTSVTFGTRINMPATILSSPHYNPVIQQTMITGSGYDYYYKIIFGSGNTISVDGADTTQWLNDGTTPSNAGPNFVNVDSTKNCWLWENGNKAKSLVKNDGMVKFVGLAKENISNGASGKVTVVGGINTAVSGLTAGKSYGLPVDSAVITEITDSTSAKIFGTALSATSIYIDKGNLR
jgi:hypothetical protein